MRFIGFGVAILSVLFALVSVFGLQPTFLQMFAEFGGELPWLTRVMLKPLTAMLFGVLPLVVMASGPTKPSRVVVAGALATVQVVLTVVAMYAPIWSLAGKIE